MPTTNNYFHLHLVSDSTGETLITVARAVAAQYANVTAVEHVYPLVRSQKQLDRVLDEIEEAPGIVLFTLLEKDLVQKLESKCREINVPSLSIIGPVMQLSGNQYYLSAVGPLEGTVTLPVHLVGNGCQDAEVPLNQFVQDIARSQGGMPRTPSDTVAGSSHIVENEHTEDLTWSLNPAD